MASIIFVSLRPFGSIYHFTNFLLKRLMVTFYSFRRSFRCQSPNFSVRLTCLHFVLSWNSILKICYFRFDKKVVKVTTLFIIFFSEFIFFFCLFQRTCQSECNADNLHHLAETLVNGFANSQGTTFYDFLLFPHKKLSLLGLCKRLIFLFVLII